MPFWVKPSGRRVQGYFSRGFRKAQPNPQMGSLRRSLNVPKRTRGEVQTLSEQNPWKKEG